MQGLSVSQYLWPLLIGSAASVAGGALAGLAIGSKDLGPNLAATMGAFFGPLAGVTGVAIGLLVLSLFG
jgi:hypothetical protein